MVNISNLKGYLFNSEEDVTLLFPAMIQNSFCQNTLDGVLLKKKEKIKVPSLERSTSTLLTIKLNVFILSYINALKIVF